KTEFVLYGIPWDYLTSIDLPNSSEAPQKIREVTQNLALTTELGFKIPKLRVVDIGDINIVTKDVSNNLKKIEKFIYDMYAQNDSVIPIMIGGDHFCSFPVIKAVGDHYRQKSNMGVLIFDAHLDLYQEWDKGVYSHATISHRVFDLDYIDNEKLLIAGSRDIDIPELEIADQENIVHLDSYLLSEKSLDAYISDIVDFFRFSNVKNLYISIDIDALDPSIAPGTGFAIPGGFTYRQMWRILRRI
ncbi:MAG: hypothetical protein GF383_13960, partial [Candidatus Lokiarchaeota archaeon]|nr:hypothetical protein [Candidatus Lokiarchaeota archaeon]MBD3342424.1 hypothetical protein [Candidatus Lokiarchaeota archaeon]